MAAQLAPRLQITQSLDALQAALRDARFLGARAEDLTLQIQDRRRALLLRQLLQRSDSILAPRLWTQAVTGLPTLGQSLSFLASDWRSLIRSRGPWLACGGLIFALLLAGAVLVPGRRLLLR